MCTLTYIPVSGGYIFTHNRDERQDRPSTREIIREKNGDQTLYFPRDLEASGTWIAHSDRGISACILNGGSIPHQRKAAYRKSRGLVVLESFGYQNPLHFKDQYNFQDIEPFTLILHHPEGLFKLIHNENSTSLETLDDRKTHIWSSTTLYTREVREKRKKWFDSWLKKDPELSPENITRFHMSAGDGDQENDLIMSRWGILKTVSLTQVASSEGGVQMTYKDFVHNSEDRVHLPLK